MNIKIATWNINSVRLRLDLVAQFLEAHHPDLLCLQEIKCRESDFPFSFFHERGWAHCAVQGQKGYHGVAIVSRFPLNVIPTRSFCFKGEARHISVQVDLPKQSGYAEKKSCLLHNFYIPAGGDIPDPALNQKFAHKLAFLDEMRAWVQQERVVEKPSFLVGDFNIAPLETDVWNHKALLSVVSHTPIEVEKLNAVFQAGPWVDALRHKIPPHERLYTWWSYRSPQWERADKGRRLDHIWTSPQLMPAIQNVQVLKEARGWERPSDHVPILLHMDPHQIPEDV